MPTYEYLCTGCDHRFEVFQRFNERQKRTCSECGEKKLRRLIGSGAGIIFKGSGFYETDYRSAEYKKRQKEEAASGSSEGSTSTDSAKDDSKSTSSGDGAKSGEGKGEGGSSS